MSECRIHFTMYFMKCLFLTTFFKKQDISIKGTTAISSVEYQYGGMLAFVKKMVDVFVGGVGQAQMASTLMVALETILF